MKRDSSSRWSSFKTPEVQNSITRVTLECLGLPVQRRDEHIAEAVSGDCAIEDEVYSLLRCHNRNKARRARSLAISGLECLSLSTLELRWREHYLDFIVNGQSLKDLLQTGNVGCLGWGVPDHEPHVIRRLLLREKSELAHGRVPIYVCSQCGDIHCGAVTARIDRARDSFIWSAFGSENNLAMERNGRLHKLDASDFKSFAGLGPFRFSKAVYVNCLKPRLGPLQKGAYPAEC